MKSRNNIFTILPFYFKKNKNAYKKTARKVYKIYEQDSDDTI